MFEPMIHARPSSGCLAKIDFPIQGDRVPPPSCDSRFGKANAGKKRIWFRLHAFSSDLRTLKLTIPRPVSQDVFN